MAENYDLIFGQGASSQYAWSDSDYQKGWQTVGSTPPTAEQFDALQRRSDTKAKDLNNRLSPLETTASKALARVTPAANRLPYFNSSNSATTTAISDFTKTLLDDKDAATARATLGAPSTTGANASGSWNINAATATKLATARKINITGNATGAATFDGTSDVSINVSVSQAAHADKATADANGRAFTDTNAYMHISALADSTDFNDVKTTGIYYCTGNTYPHKPQDSWGILTVYSIGTVKQEYRPDNAAVYYTREYDNRNWTAWSKVNAANADTATKLATPRAISLTGNASGSANFDGSGNISINTTVNESKHAAAATGLNCYAKRPADANIQKGDGLVRYFLATAEMTKNKPPGEDGHILSFAWDYDTGYDAQLCVNAVTGHTHTRGQNAGKWSDWLTFLDSANFNSYAPTKTGGGASGTWGINITGNADSATNADKVDGYHENSFLRYREAAAATGEDTLWNQIGIKEYVKKLPKGVSDTYNYGAVVSLPGDNARLDIWYNHHCSANKDGLWYRSGFWSDQKPWARLLDSNNYTNWAPTKTGAGASGTWPISISGNADQLDGAHLADVYRQVGGHNTPTITSIIDWNTMKACNGGTDVRNINNTTYGVTAYGGDSNFSSGVLKGYAKGSFYLTQDYTNFDKLCFLFCSDTGKDIEYTMTDVFLLNYIMTNYSVVNLSHDDDDFWIVTGYSNKGTAKDKVSTKRIFSAPASMDANNCGIVDVLGIKY